MNLKEFGARSWASLREIETNDAGEVVCPVSKLVADYSRGEIEIPVTHLADDQLRDALEAAGVNHVRGHGYESPKYDVLMPEEVGGPAASGWSSRMVGVRVELPGTEIWTPVRQEDLEPADDALEAAAATDGGATSSRSVESTDGSSPDSADESGPTRPAIAEELDLPTEYPDGTPRYTYVGHAQQDDVDVYAGRHGENGQKDLLTAEIGEAGWLGNPYPAGAFGRREAVGMFTHAFLHEIEERPELRAAVYEQVRGNVLGCWCQRLEETGDDADLCHAEVIARVADVLRRTGGDQT